MLRAPLQRSGSRTQTTAAAESLWLSFVPPHPVDELAQASRNEKFWPTGQQNGSINVSEPMSEIDEAQQKLAALVDFIEELAATVAPEAAEELDRSRLQETVDACLGLDRGLVSIGLVVAAAANADRRDAHPFASSLRTQLTSEVEQSLDHLSETLLMISNAELQASGIIVASVLVQRALPQGSAGVDLVLRVLLELVDAQFQERASRHAAVFAPLRQMEKNISLKALPDTLSEISEALEDIACDDDVFLDNPVELKPKKPIDVVSAEKTFEHERLRSGANLPAMSTEMKHIRKLTDMLGLTRDQVFSIVADLYRHKVMDSRSKIGLSLASVVSIVENLETVLEGKLDNIKINDERGVKQPYAYDSEDNSVVLNTRYRSGLTTRIVKEDSEKMLDQLRQAKADKEATQLSKAIERYQAARAKVASNAMTGEEDEQSSITALSTQMQLTMAEAYDVAAGVYGAERLTLSSDSRDGLSLARIAQIIEAAGEPGTVTSIDVDVEADGRRPFRIDREEHRLVFQPAFRPLSDDMIDWYLSNYSLEPQPLAEPDGAFTGRYEDPEAPGSVANRQNLEQLINEFDLNKEFGMDSFDVMLEGCPGFKDALSVQTLRVVMASINQRLEADRRINLITGWQRDVPAAQSSDRISVGWLTSHQEDDTTLELLSFNFFYGEDRKAIPAITDEIVREWCQHHILS